MFNLTAAILINILLLDEKCRENKEAVMTHGGILYKCRFERYRTMVEINGTTQSGTVCLRRDGTFLATTQRECAVIYFDRYDVSYKSDRSDIGEDERVLSLLQEVHLDLERVHIQNDLLLQLPNLKSLGVIFSNSSITPDVISGLQDLHSLLLENSPIRAIPADFFRNQQKLVYLIYSNSALEVIGDDTFKNMSSLEKLELNHNQLVDISSGAFTTLTSLDILRLNDNKLSTLPQNLLASLSGLSHINLSHNRLRMIPATLFQNNSRLEYLNLEGNQLEDIPGEVFTAQTELTILRLSNNKLKTLPTTLFSKLENLLILGLKGNMLSTLPDGLFSSNSELSRLDLGSNQLANVTAETFSTLSRIDRLLLGSNKLSSLPDNLLFKNRELTYLDLSRNMLQALPAGLFDHTEDLINFDAAYNKITDLPSSLFPVDLEVLELSHNLLKRSPFISAFKGAKHPLEIERVYLRNNSISSVVDSYLRLPFLEILDLSHNNITQLDSPHWLDTTKVSLNFSNNQITHINCDGCTQYFSELLLNNNPIICDLHLMNLLKEIQLNQTEKVVEGTCAEPVQYRGENISSFKKLDVPPAKGCPKKCICSELVLHIRQVEVNCTAKDLVELPDIFQLSRSYEKIIVIAAHNRISSITHNSLRGYENVSLLDVGHNHLKEIAVSNMTKLEYIDISFNDLHDLHSIAQFMDKATTIRAAGNPWDCECRATISLFSTMKANTTVVDMDRVRCSTGAQLSPFLFRHICQNHRKEILIATLSAVLLLVAVTGYILRRKIKSWLTAHNLNPLESDGKRRSRMQNEVPMGMEESSNEIS